MKEFHKNHRILVRGVYFTISICLVMISLTAYWINNVIYDTSNFTRIAETALNKESSRQAIASRASELAFDGNPLLEATLSPKLHELLTGALNSSIAQKIIHNTVEDLQIVLTTSQKSPIVVDMKGIKAVLSKGQEILPEYEKINIDTAKLPDSIMIIDTTKIPNIYKYGIWASWIGPLSLALVLAMLGYWVKRGTRDNMILRLRIVMQVLLIASLVAMFVGPLVKPTILSVAANAEAQSLLGNLYEGFISPFNQVASRLGVFALSAWVVLFSYSWFIDRYKIKASLKISKKSA